MFLKLTSIKGDIICVNTETVTYIYRGSSDKKTVVKFDKEHAVFVQETPEEIAKLQKNEMMKIHQPL